MKKRNKGITLVALIIAIIVLLILATVTTTVVMEDSIIEHAKESKYSTEIASEKETIQKALTISKVLSKTGTITAEKVKKALDENIATAVSNGNKIVIQFVQSGRIYEVSENGDIEEFTPYVDSTPGELAQNSNNEYMIESIEDLVVLSAIANGGYQDDQLDLKALSTSATHTYILMRDLDFKSSLSYVDPLTTKYNGYLGVEDENVTLMEALTNIDEYKGFIPIGTSDRKISVIFDGKGYQIGNLSENVQDYAGLFGYISRNVIIKNLTVSGEIKSITTYAGGIAGGACGEITNCTNYAKVSGINAGGICGLLTGNMEFNKCTNYGEVYASSEYAGGISGYNIYSDIELNYCINAGDVSGTNAGGIMGAKTSGSVTFNSCINSVDGEVKGIGEKNYAGGIIGRKTNPVNFYIYNCANLGEVSGNDAGGMLGRPAWWGSDILANCLGFGIITGNCAGGLIGYAPGGDTIYNSYYLLSDLIKNDIGSSSSPVHAEGVTEINTNIINSLNAYIEENEDEIDTTGWAKWVLNNKSEPTLDFTQIWDGTQWVTE